MSDSLTLDMTLAKPLPEGRNPGWWEIAKRAREEPTASQSAAATAVETSESARESERKLNLLCSLTAEVAHKKCLPRKSGG